MQVQGDPNQIGKPLTKREKQVMQALTEFDHQAEVARHLEIDVRTVNFHTANVRAKLDCGSTHRALLILVKLGEVQV